MSSSSAVLPGYARAPARRIGLPGARAGCRWAGRDSTGRGCRWPGATARSHCRGGCRVRAGSGRGIRRRAGRGNSGRGRSRRAGATARAASFPATGRLRGAVHPLQLAHLRRASLMRGNSCPVSRHARWGHAREQGEGGARLEFEGQGQAVVETIELGRLARVRSVPAGAAPGSSARAAGRASTGPATAGQPWLPVGRVRWVAGGRRRRG